MKPLEDLIEKAKKVIEEGGIIIFPTETLYGIGCSPFNNKGVEKLLELKKRKRENPFPLVAGSMNTIKEYFKVDSTSYKLAREFWPGPLTLLLYPVTKIHPAVEKEGKCGVRIPSNLLLLILLKELKKPLIATSANLSGETPPLTPEEISPILLKKADMVIKTGPVGRNRVPSTVFDPEKREIIREGAILRNKLELFLK